MLAYTSNIKGKCKITRVEGDFKWSGMHEWDSANSNDGSRSP